MDNLKIKFYWNGGFAGVTYEMMVNEDHFNLNDIYSIQDERYAKIKAINILKEKYNISYCIENINFEFGGCL